MDITFPRSGLARLIGIAASGFSLRASRPAQPTSTTGAERAKHNQETRHCLAPMRRRERPMAEVDTDLLLARVGPLGPYLGALRR